MENNHGPWGRGAEDSVNDVQSEDDVALPWWQWWPKPSKTESAFPFSSSLNLPCLLLSRPTLKTFFVSLFPSFLSFFLFIILSSSCLRSLSLIPPQLNTHLRHVDLSSKLHHSPPRQQQQQQRQHRTPGQLLIQPRAPQR